jgi:hypothetical protein
MKLPLVPLSLLVLAFVNSTATAQQSAVQSTPITATSLRPAFDTILPKIRKCAQQIIEEHDKNCNASTLTGLAAHIVEEHAIHVFVRFEPQPMGGILTVRADLVAAYQGVGTATRPIASRETTQAVEGISSEEIEEISRMLVAQLGDDYSKGSIYKQKMDKNPDGSVVVNMDYKLSPHTHGME